MKRSVKIVLSVVLFFVILSTGGVFLLYRSMFGDNSTYDEHVSSFEGLPAAASDITVYTNKNISGVVTADFNIRENDFIDWAENYKWSLTEIVSPVSIPTATAFSKGKPNNDRKVLKNGLHASLRKPNGGGIDLAYDRLNGRAYISRSSN